MRGQDYDRTMRHFEILEGEGAREALHHVVQSLGAISWMLRCTLLQEEQEGTCARPEGVFKLLEQQCAMLNGIYEELGVEEEKRDTDSEAKGIVHQSQTPTEALVEPAHKLRVQFIESNANAGVDHGLIAAALNLSEDAIQHTMARLRGEAAPAAAKAAGRRAGAR